MTLGDETCGLLQVRRINRRLCVAIGADEPDAQFAQLVHEARKICHRGHRLNLGSTGRGFTDDGRQADITTAGDNDQIDTGRIDIQST